MMPCGITTTQLRVGMKSLISPQTSTSPDITCTMKFSKMRIAFWALALSFQIWIASGEEIGPVEIYFEETGQTVTESSSTITVTVKLSEPSLFDITFPYVVHSSSTVVQGEDEDDETGDFYFQEDDIDEDDEDNSFDNESPITIQSGDTEATIYITLMNDNEIEGDEYLVLDLVEDGLTVAKLGDITRHTIRILDNDQISVYVASHEFEFMETSDITVPVRVSSVSESDIEVTYTIEYLTLDDKDIDEDSSYNSDNPVEISAGASSASILLNVLNDSVTDRNEGGADEEQLIITLDRAILIDTGELLEVDSEPIYVTIIDNDPLMAELVFDEDEDQPFEVEEYGTISVRVKLTWWENPDADEDEILSSGSDSIFVPLYFSGTATRGEDEDDESGDYYIDDGDFEDELLEITSGSTSGTVTITLVNDELIEDPESLIVTMGQPYYEDGGDIVMGEKIEMSFEIQDNDPIDLSFAAFYAIDDELAAEDEDYEDIVYIPESSSIVAESWGSASIPIYMSSPSRWDVTFDFEIVSSGTTATLYDLDWDEDKYGEQDWDYYVSIPTDFEEVDEPVEITISAGSSYAAITLVINDDDETPTIYGQEPADDVEDDETITFRISNLVIEDDEGGVSFGEDTTYTLTIKELEDIDITALVEGLSPAADCLVNGAPVENPLTSLFEVHYDMSLNTELNIEDYPGYSSIKAQFRTSNYDAANPDAESNDDTYQYPEDEDLDDGDEFHYYVKPPCQFRYPSASQYIVLKEGEDPVDDYYTEATANTYEIAPYLLKPINAPVLNEDFEAEIYWAFDVNDKLDWWVDFYSMGYDSIDVSRIDPALGGDHRVRVYLTSESTAVYASSSTSLPIERLEPQLDGSVYLVASISNATSVQVQYLDAGDEWKVAQPATINTGGSSKFFWVDKGPPATQVHPSEVPFRLYRVISL